MLTTEAGHTDDDGSGTHEAFRRGEYYGPRRGYQFSAGPCCGASGTTGRDTATPQTAMTPTVTDFTDAEQNLVANLLVQRYGKLVPPQLADSELQLDPGSDELTLCPTLYWSEQGAQFVVCKTGEDRYRCQFFYSDTEQYGTGNVEYGSLEDCVLTLLRVQADHQHKRAGLFSGATASDLGDDYCGPVMI